MLQNIEDIIYYRFESFTKKLQFNKKRFRDFNRDIRIDNNEFFHVQTNSKKY